VSIIFTRKISTTRHIQSSTHWHWFLRHAVISAFHSDFLQTSFGRLDTRCSTLPPHFSAPHNRKWGEAHNTYKFIQLCLPHSKSPFVHQIFNGYNQSCRNARPAASGACTNTLQPCSIYHTRSFLARTPSTEPIHSLLTLWPPPCPYWPCWLQPRLPGPAIISLSQSAFHREMQYLITSLPHKHLSIQLPLHLTRLVRVTTSPTRH